MQAISETERAVHELANAHGWWNTWSVRLVALTVIVTALYFVAQWMTNKRGNELSRAQAVLIKAKDDQLAANLKGKDDEAQRIEREANQKIADTYKEAKRIETDAQKEIVRLTADGEKAKEGVETAKTDALRAKEGIASAEARSVEAAAEVARLQEVVANAEKRRLEAEKALLELQERMKRRHLTPDLRARFVAFLKANPKGAVTVMTQGDDNDSNRFGAELVSAIVEAGWTLKGNQNNLGEQFNPGLFLAIHSADALPENGGFLQKALTDIGFPPIGVIDPKHAPSAGDLTLVIGPRAQ